jgi:hypothetical protein
MIKLLPIVVTTVLEKKRDCPKLQFGSPDTFLAAETPLLLAFTTSSISFSRSSSEDRKTIAVFTFGSKIQAVVQMYSAS